MNVAALDNLVERRHLPPELGGKHEHNQPAWVRFRKVSRTSLVMLQGSYGALKTLSSEFNALKVLEFPQLDLESLEFNLSSSY